MERFQKCFLTLSVLALALARRAPGAEGQNCDRSVLFEQDSSFEVGGNPGGVIAVDFNGDDKVDLATANYDSDDVSVLLGKGDGTFEAQARRRRRAFLGLGVPAHCRLPPGLCGSLRC